ncbi:MAG: hypothetical protein LC769_02455 [Chloroflexi bacterium]|nr:hypothetical protein [Chloroflexota bacterium]
MPQDCEGARRGRWPASPGRASPGRRPKALSVSPRRRCGRGRARWAARTGTGAPRVFLDTPTIPATMVVVGGCASSAGGAPGARRERTATHERWSGG